MTEPTSIAARTAFAALRPELGALYRRQWAQPELPMMERRSAATLCDCLESHGFLVERGVGGLPTAFRASAEVGTGGPAIGLLAEYDALPAVAAATAPAFMPPPEGLPADVGHACGHNHIGPNAAIAGIAAARALAATGTAGRVIVYGTPAEEILWGKIAMLQQGVFEGCDLLLANHADYQSGALSRPCQAVVIGELVFQGAARHSGLGRAPNALDGLELTVQTIERLRGTRLADCIIAHVVRAGGVTPGVVPAETRLALAIKHVASFERALEVWHLVTEIAAAEAAHARVRVVPVYLAGSRGYLANDAAGRILQEAAEQVGAPVYDAEALAWMEALSTAVSGPGFDLPAGLGWFTEGCDPYGQDDGELSWRTPLARINWALPAGVPLHNWAMTAICGYAGFDPGPTMAAEAMAIATVAFCARPGIVAEAEAEREARVAGRDLVCPPVGLFDVMTRTPELYWSARYPVPAPMPG